MGRYRNELTFRRTAPDEARIFANGEYVGDIYRQRDILHEGAVLTSTSRTTPGPGAACTSATASARSPPSASDTHPFRS